MFINVLLNYLIELNFISTFQIRSNISSMLKMLSSHDFTSLHLNFQKVHTILINLYCIHQNLLFIILFAHPNYLQYHIKIFPV